MPNHLKIAPGGLGLSLCDFFLKSGFCQIDVFTKYRCCNTSKWPQMPQKWIRTTLFWILESHGLRPFFDIFIALFVAKCNQDPPGAPWLWGLRTLLPTIRFSTYPDLRKSKSKTIYIVGPRGAALEKPTLVELRVRALPWVGGTSRPVRACFASR